METCCSIQKLTCLKKRDIDAQTERRRAEQLGAAPPAPAADAVVDAAADADAESDGEVDADADDALTS